jgi:hypothetical protein
MTPLVLYVPLAVAVAVLCACCVRGAARGYGNGRLVPLSVVLGAVLGGSVVLMVGVGEAWSRWAAVGLLGVVAVPLLTPIMLVLVTVVIGWVTGKPPRWN